MRLSIQRLFPERHTRRAGQWLLYCVLTGVLAGMGAIVLHWVLQLGHHYFLDLLAGFRPPYPAGDRPLFPETDTPFRPQLLWMIPALGGLLAGLVTWYFCPDAAGHGTDAAIEAYHHKEGRISIKVPIVKTITSAFTLGSGGSGGSEGPICQIGAGLGSALAQGLKLSPRETRILMAAGMGAGIGSIFRAPLSGALFAAEILYSGTEFEADVIIPGAIACGVAYSLFCSVYGWGSLFRATDFRFDNPLALGPYTVLVGAVVVGVCLFVNIFWGIHDFFQRLRLPMWIKPVIGGLLTGVMGLYLPQVLGFSYGFIQQGLNTSLPAKLFLAVALGKIFATAFSIGSGGSGGVFGPSVVIGGALGGAVGVFFHDLLPSIVPSHEPFVVVGMAGFLAAGSNIPITAVIVVSEITGSYHLLLPSMLVCSLSYYLSRRWDLYRAQVPDKIASPAHRGDFFTDVLEGIKVKDIFDPTKTIAAIPEDMSFSQFCRFFSATDQHYFPVVDKEGRLTGIFSINDVRHCLFDDILGPVVVMKDIALKDVITTHPDEDINTLLKKFTVKNIDRLPVVDREDPQKLLGMISRREVIDFYNRALDRMKRSREEGEGQ